METHTCTHYRDCPLTRATHQEGTDTPRCTVHLLRRNTRSETPPIRPGAKMKLKANDIKQEFRSVLFVRAFAFPHQCRPRALADPRTPSPLWWKGGKRRGESQLASHSRSQNALSLGAPFPIPHLHHHHHCVRARVCVR